MSMTITAYIERDTETGMYVAIVPTIPGAHTQAETLDELQRTIKAECLPVRSSGKS